MSAFGNVAKESAWALVEMLGEWVTYIPHRGDPRRLRAIVIRDTPETLPHSSAAIGENVRLRFFEDPTRRNGIAANELDPGRDQVELEVRIGQGKETRSITQPPADDDDGFLTVRVR